MTPSNPLPATPFNRRVRLLIEVVDQPDEVDLATRLLADRGWAVRPVVEADNATVGDRRVGLIVEVRLRGSRRGARTAAVRQVERLADQAKVGLWVRDSVLLEFAKERRTTYFAHNVPAEGGRFTRWAAELWAAIGGSDIERALSLPGPADEASATAELQQRTLGGKPFDPAMHTVRVQVGPRSPFPDDEGPVRRMDLIRVVALAVAVASVPLACGAVMESVHGLWRLVPVLPLLALSWPVGQWLTGNTHRPWSLGLLVGLICTLCTAYLGYQFMATSDGRAAVEWPLVVGGTAIAGLTVYGLWFALSHSWFSRNASWLVPVLAAPLPFVLPWFGRLLQTAYLSDMFGIPADTIPIAFYWSYMAALKPVLIATGLLLMFIAVIGWGRHFHVLAVMREFISVAIPILCLLYVATALFVGLTNAGAAADRAAAAAREGKTPASYFGIQGNLMCLKPLADDISVFNGPVPTDYLVLTFGSTGDRIWVWDPRRAVGSDGSMRSVSVRLEDVAVTPPTGRRGTCPAAP